MPAEATARPTLTEHHSPGPSPDHGPGCALIRLSVVCATRLSTTDLTNTAYHAPGKAGEVIAIGEVTAGFGHGGASAG